MAKLSPVEKIHQRLSSDLPINSRVSIAIVDDPMGTILGEKIQVIRSERDDPLAGMLSRGQITKEQFDGGREWQRHHENAQLGSLKAMDPAKPFVDGGKPMTALSRLQIEASEQLIIANTALGSNGAVLVFDILGSRKTIAQAAFDRGLTSDPDIKFIGKRFRECLTTLSELLIV